MVVFLFGTDVLRSISCGMGAVWFSAMVGSVVSSVVGGSLRFVASSACFRAAAVCFRLVAVFLIFGGIVAGGMVAAVSLSLGGIIATLVRFSSVLYIDS